MGSGAGNIYEGERGSSRGIKGQDNGRSLSASGGSTGAHSRPKAKSGQTDGRVSKGSSIEENVESVRKTYELHEDGYFAERGVKPHIREFVSETPQSSAKDFYHKLGKGGKESDIPGGIGLRRRLDDGTWVNIRLKTSTPDSPAVQISSSASKMVKNQKVHFLKGC